MIKIKLTTTLNSNDGITSYEGVGILKDNVIIFYENGIKVCINKNNNSIDLSRISDEYKIFLKFEDSLTKEGNYDISDSVQIPIKTVTKKLDICDTNIHIEYELEIGGVDQGSFIYDVNYEVIE